MNNNLPLIDISPLSSSSKNERLAVADALHDACRNYGFFYCTGHGVPQALTRTVLQQARAFFNLPLEQKLKLDKSGSPCNRGYENLGNQTLQPGALPDRKEGYYIGEEVSPDDPRYGHFNLGRNQWPADLPGFRAVMMAYYGAMTVVGETLIRGLALSLKQPEHAFEPFTRQPLSAVRLLHYPPCRPEVPDEMGAGAHTDFGGITLLLQDDVGGLQVKEKDGNGWIDAPVIDGAYIVNLGDMMARWTNDYYVSTLHRVINRSGRERYSVPFFYTGNPSYEVRCIDSCLQPGEQPKYAPTTVEQHMKAMYARTYAAPTPTPT
jgi:isopenicillin N synthase-like dioxygenase